MSPYDYIKENEALTKGFTGFSVELSMDTLKNKKTYYRQANIVSREGDDTDGEKNLLEFLQPKKLKGTKFLSHAKQHKKNNQWIYLPKTKRIRKIIEKSGDISFFGTEFSYNDILPKDIDYFEYRFTGDSEIQIAPGKILITRYKDDMVEDIVMDKNTYLIDKIYFHKHGKINKVLEVEKYILVDGKWNMPETAIMINNINHNKTVVNYRNYDFSVEVPVEKFNKSALTY
jgi:hypothetical protein